MIALLLHRIIVVGAITGGLFTSAFAAEPLPPESTTPWKVDNSPFTGKKEKKAFSGLACAHTGICVLAVDEGRHGAVVRIQGKRLVFVGEPFKFTGVEQELDAEAVAVDEVYFYVTGSHAAKRDSGCDNPDSRRVYRLTVDESGDLRTIEPSTRLWEAMRGLSKLAPYAVTGQCHCKMDRVDIEGMAAANGRLFFALRAPNVGGNSYVVGVDAKALFDGGDLKPSLYEISLGANKGFRDLMIADGEALALVGPSDNRSLTDYSIVELRGLTTGPSVHPKELVTLDLKDAPLSKKGKPIKPEAITLLDINAERYRLLVLSDGGKNGAPLVFDVTRKP